MQYNDLSFSTILLNYQYLYTENWTGPDIFGFKHLEFLCDLNLLWDDLEKFTWW